LSKVEIHVKNEHCMIISGSGDPHEPGEIIDHTQPAEPAESQPAPPAFNDLDVRKKAEQLFMLIWTNGFCNMTALQAARHYIETIAEVARELPAVVDYNRTNWVLEWQMPAPKVRKLCLEFSIIASGAGRMIACSEKVVPDTRERVPFVKPLGRMTAESIRQAFRWYYTPEHVMFIDSPRSAD
jgi:hypothetical protein